MLEHRTLLLHPWTPAPPAGADRPFESREIVDAATGRRLGVARRLLAEGSLFAWIAGPVVEVCEADDEPLLFTVQRAWPLAPRWEVRDADGHRVAVVRRNLVLDRHGQPTAWAHRVPEDGGIQFCDRDGVELAFLRQTGRGAELAFTEELDGEPFVKMALLAAVLCGVGHRG